MGVFPSTVGFVVLVEHPSGNSVVRPKIADLGPASVQRPHCYREATKAKTHRKPMSALGNFHFSGRRILIHVRASLFWADTALQKFWCARRDSNPHDVTHCHLKAARLPIPPRALERSARDLRPTRSTAPM